MARTKASVGAKVVSGKSSKARCSVAPSTSTGVSAGSSSRNSNIGVGGNPVHPRETPKWQKPITNFFVHVGNQNDSNDESDTEVTQKPKRSNVIHSDEENEKEVANGEEKEMESVEEVETPKNKALDDTIELTPLTGEGSHKIEEFYQKNDKGKGVGKRSKGKENKADNSGRKSSLKRNLDIEDDVQTNKRVKVV